MSRDCIIKFGDRTIRIGEAHPLTIIAGPCALESYDIAMQVAEPIRTACADAGLNYIFKASYDKANRTSRTSKRGPGIDEGLATLERIRNELNVPVTTDIHAPEQAEPVAAVVDVLQIPAFLCRQTDLLVAAADAAVRHTRAINIKKGQFLSPAEMVGPVDKVHAAGCHDIIITERGTFFGYHRLVNDFIGVGDLIELQAEGGSPPVCFDATHSTQLPGISTQTGGRPERCPLLTRAAVAAGVHAVFIESHPDPPAALSDAATQLPVGRVTALLPELARIRAALANAT